MKYFVIGEEDVVTGFRYAGIEGETVQSAEEAYDALNRAQQNSEIGILVLQDTFSAELRDTISKIRFTTRTPLIVEIPGPAGKAEGRPSLLELIQEAVGIKV